jgi:hypothetical protein
MKKLKHLRKRRNKLGRYEMQKKFKQPGKRKLE